MDDWVGWRIAGVRPEVLSKRSNAGITHRLIGVLGHNKEAATRAGYKILGNDADPADVASLVRAYIMGQTIVEDEVISSRYASQSSAQDNYKTVHATAGIVHSCTRTHSELNCIPRKRPLVETGELLRDHETQASRTEAQRLMQLAKQVPAAGCWRRVIGRSNAEEQLTRWFTPTKASSRRTYLNEFLRFQTLAKRSGRNPWDLSADALGRCIWDRQDEPCGATVPMAILHAVSTIADLLDLAHGGRDMLLRQDALR